MEKGVANFDGATTAYQYKEQNPNQEVSRRTEETPEEKEKFRALRGELMRLAPEKAEFFDTLERDEQRKFIAELKNISASLEKEFKFKLYETPNSKHLSNKEKEEAAKAFASVPIAERRERVKAVESWLVFEAQKSAEFEKLTEELWLKFEKNRSDKSGKSTEEQTKKGPDKKRLTVKLRAQFYNATYKEKLSILARLKEKLNMSSEKEKETLKLVKQYEAFIAKKVQARVISKTTAYDFGIWLRHQDLEGKKEAIAKFADEMEPRTTLMKRFKYEIDPELQKREEANQQTGFYTLSFTRRRERFTRLLEQTNSMKTKTGIPANSSATGIAPPSQFDRTALEKDIAEIKGTKPVKKMMEQYTIGRVVTTAVRNTEQRSKKRRPGSQVLTARDIAQKDRKLKGGDDLELMIWNVQWASNDNRKRRAVRRIGDQFQKDSEAIGSVDVKVRGFDGEKMSADGVAKKLKENREYMIGRITKDVAGKIERRNPKEKLNQDTITNIRQIAEETNLEISLAEAA